MIIHDCEQGTDEWLALRAGIPTGSEFSKLITSTGAPSKSMPDYAAVLAAELYAGHPVDTWNGNKYTDRGTELEPEARAAYEFQKGVTVEQVGFITDDLKQYGASPDGLVGDDGMAEFKCQIAKEHIKTLLYFKKHGKCPTTYVAQTQGELLVAERKWNDLVFYHPDLPMLIISIKPDIKISTGLKAQLSACIAERNIILKTLKEF